MWISNLESWQLSILLYLTSNIFNYSYKLFKWIIYFLVVYKQRLKHLQGFENLAGARFIVCTMRYEKNSSLLAPGGAASFADGFGSKDKAYHGRGCVVQSVRVLLINCPKN